MSDFVPEPPSYLPTIDEPLTGEEALAAIESALEAQPTQIDLLISPDPPAPLGKSYLFDFGVQEFVTGHGVRGPLATYGVETLRGWIRKALMDVRGAYAIHPQGYGLAEGNQLLFGGPVGVVPADLEERIRDALTFHPRISDVSDFAFTFSDDDEYLAGEFTVELDQGVAFSVLARMRVTA